MIFHTSFSLVMLLNEADKVEEGLIVLDFCNARKSYDPDLWDNDTKNVQGHLYKKANQIL